MYRSYAKHILTSIFWFASNMKQQAAAFGQNEREVLCCVRDMKEGGYLERVWAMEPFWASVCRGAARTRQFKSCLLVHANLTIGSNCNLAGFQTCNHPTLQSVIFRSPAPVISTQARWQSPAFDRTNQCRIKEVRVKQHLLIKKIGLSYKKTALFDSTFTSKSPLIF